MENKLKDMRSGAPNLEVPAEEVVLGAAGARNY